MHRFLIVDEYPEPSIWDDYVDGPMLSLASQPAKWAGSVNNRLPEGDWSLGHTCLSMSSEEGWRAYGIEKPQACELPVVYFFPEIGEMERITEATVDQLAEFISSRL